MHKLKASALKITLAIGLTGSIAFGAYAHGGATGIVKERMDAMLDMAKSMKVLVATFKGATKYNADSVRSAAAKIRDHAGDNIVSKFPEGSLKHGSEARPEIWQDWSRFTTMAKDLEVYAGALVENADRFEVQGGAAMGNGGMMGGGAGMMGGGSMMNGSTGMMGGGNAGAGMMGGGMMGGAAARPTAEMLAQMPAQGLFTMVTQTCSSCHSRFRKEKK